MSLTLLIGDLHYKKSNKDETDEFEKSILEYLEQNQNFEKIIVLGDILDTHEKINISPLIRATKFLIRLSSYSITYVLVGNHDRPNGEVFLTEEHSLYPLKFTAYDIEIIDKVYIEDDLIFVPYVEPGRFMEALGTKKIFKEELENGKYKYIFAHQEFFGAQMGGLISQMGDKWNKNYPRIISGHIHDYQVLDNITYIGTPYQTGYGDNPNKGIYILDQNGDLEKISLNITPKIIIHLPIEEVLDYNFPEDAKIKLVIEGDASEVRKIINTGEYRRKLKNIKCSIKDIPKHISFDLGGGEKRLLTIPKIIELIKKDCKDQVEEEILDKLFPIS